MSVLSEIINIIISRIGSDVGSVAEIVSMLLMTTVLAFYEFGVYRVVSHRAIYNKAFHISIMVLPFFIGAIVMALQSNLVITLGTIGALAIIRFRTAVKDPVDMIYILWSVFVGITCGCQLYELCIFTSVFVTIVLVAINLLSGSLLRNPFVLVLNCEEDIEETLNELIKSNAKNYRLKSRNYTSKGVDYVYQLDTKNITELTKAVGGLEKVKQFSVLEFDNEDIV